MHKKFRLPFVNSMSKTKAHDINRPVMTIVETGAGYRITQVGDFDYADHFEAYHDDRPRRPRELVLEIILPGLTDPSAIDAEVNVKSVVVKAPGVFQGRNVKHNFTIPLPFEVLTNIEYSASFAQQVLTLKLKVKQIKVERKPFQVKEEQNSESDGEEKNDNQEEIVDALKEVQQEALKEDRDEKKGGEKVIKQAKFSLTTEEKVVTVVLYVPRAKEDSLRIDGNHISVETKDGQIYECDINPPFPLKSVPVMRTNPVTMYLIFVEKEDEEKPVQKQEEEKIEEILEQETVRELQNPYIYDLDMN